MFSDAIWAALAVAIIGTTAGGILVAHYARWLERARPGDVGFWIGAIPGALAFGLCADWLLRAMSDDVVRYTLEWFFSVGAMAFVGGILCGFAGALIGLIRTARRSY